MPVTFTDADLAAVLQGPLDTASIDAVRRLVTALVRAFTGGGGFDQYGVPDDDLAAVIAMASTRLYANPERLRSETIGSYSYVSALSGFWDPDLELPVLRAKRLSTAVNAALSWP